MHILFLGVIGWFIGGWIHQFIAGPVEEWD